MKLTDEQLTGLARFLGEPHRAGCEMLCIATLMADGRESWEPVVRTDGELMLLLLARAARCGHFVELLGPCGGDEENDPDDWEATVMDNSGGQVLGYGHSKQPADAVILAVLKLKAAQP